MTDIFKKHPQVKVYAVGGSVRDELMGKEPKDHDYVVVGANPQIMESLGFDGVGKDFLVYLHPVTRDEYALARMERSNGVGHNNFECYYENVTLEQDLYRRDLTINAVAKDLETGEYIDPFGGRKDIESKTFRHVSEAFKEDPLRVLRVARFWARFGEDWKVDPSLTHVMREVYADGSMAHLSKHRIWKEMEKALAEPSPYIFFRMMSHFDFFPEYQALQGVRQKAENHPEIFVDTHTDMVMQYAADNYSPDVVFAGLCHDFGKPSCMAMRGNFHGHDDAGLVPTRDFCLRYAVPKEYQELALLVCKYHIKIHGVMGRNGQKATRPKSIMSLFEGTSALSKPNRFLRILEACEADAKGRGGDKPNQEYHQSAYWQQCLTAAMSVDAKAVVRQGQAMGHTGKQLGEDVRVARINAIRQVYKCLLEHQKNS